MSKRPLGFSLIEVLIAVALLGIVLMIATDASRLIAAFARQAKLAGETDEVYRELELILNDQTNCTCNLRGLKIAGPTATSKISSLGFFPNMTTTSGLNCGMQNPSLVTGQNFVRDKDDTTSSGTRIESIEIGPFHPVGDEGAHLTAVTLATVDTSGGSPARKPYSFSILALIKNQSEIRGCIGTQNFRNGGGTKMGNPLASPASGKLYRYTEVSIYKDCHPTHFSSVKKIQSSRVDYFWPQEYGNFFVSQQEVTQGAPLPWYIHANVDPTCCCGGDANAEGQRKVKLITHPRRALKDCAELRKRFLTGEPTPFAVTVVGQSIRYPCSE